MVGKKQQAALLQARKTLDSKLLVTLRALESKAVAAFQDDHDRILEAIGMIQSLLEVMQENACFTPEQREQIGRIVTMWDRVLWQGFNESGA